MPELESESIPKSRKVFSNALLVAFVFTLISGVYTVPGFSVFSAMVIYLGFPFHWLYVIDVGFTGGKITSSFLWAGFVVDFLMYAVVAASAIYIYEKKLKQVSKPVWLSATLLVVCCWLFLLYRTYADLTLWRSDFVFEVGTYDFLLIILRVESFLRFLIGVTLSIFTWVLIKYRKQSTQ